MRILLDTCTFLWLATDDVHLSRQARTRCEDPYNDLFLSSISLWEIGVKQALGKLALPGPPAEVLARWPDRMLICQALAHDLTLLTPDSEIRKYSAEVTW